MAAGLADEERLDVGEPHVIRPSIRADREPVAAVVVRAVDQDAARTGVGGVNIAAAHLQLWSLGVGRLWTCRRSRNISAAPRGDCSSGRMRHRHSRPLQNSLWPQSREVRATTRSRQRRFAVIASLIVAVVVFIARVAQARG